LTTELKNAAGSVVATLSASQSVNAGAVYKFDQNGTVSSPHLWTPSDPYLYTAVSTVKIGTNIVDVVTTKCGIRTVEWNKTTKKFTINGQALLLKGWGQKPTNEYASLGAVPDWLHIKDIRLQKDAGGNILRWGHSAGLPVALDAGDSIGVMQWQPNLSSEQDYTGVPLERKNLAYRDIVIRDRNHPSLVLWEGNNRPGNAGTSHTKMWRDIADQWDWIVHRPYSVRRPTFGGDVDCQWVDLSIETNNENNYCKELPRVESEFYRPEAPRRYWDEESFPGPHPNAGSGGYGRTNRSAMRELINDWEDIKARGGGVKWHFTDCCSHGRCPVEVTRCSGVLDGMHVPKDMYYASKAIWRDDIPVVHIMGHCNYTSAHTVDVYTNCDQVELFLDGASQGSKSPSKGLCQWPNLSLANTKVMRAVGKNGGAEKCSDERKKAGVAAKIVLTAITNPYGMKADRADVALIDATIVDADGIRCPVAANAITFSVTGQGSYRGGYNSHIQDTPGKATLYADAGLIRVGVRSTNTPGEFTVTAKASGLMDGTITVKTVAPDTQTGIRPVAGAGIADFSAQDGIWNVVRQRNGNTLRVSYFLNHSGRVTFSLMQVNGKTVSSYSLENPGAGNHTCMVPLTDGSAAVTPGCYIVRMSVQGGGEDYSRFVLMQ
jgi:beta-galactosidase